MLSDLESMSSYGSHSPAHNFPGSLVSSLYFRDNHFCCAFFFLVTVSQCRLRTDVMVLLSPPDWAAFSHFLFFFILQLKKKLHYYHGTFSLLSLYVSAMVYIYMYIVLWGCPIMHNHHTIIMLFFFCSTCNFTVCLPPLKYSLLFPLFFCPIFFWMSEGGKKCNQVKFTLTFYW